MTTATSTDLKQRWADLLAQAPKTRIRNAAQELGVSEAELLATRVGDGVVRLSDDYRAILGEVVSLGKVMALSRNDDAVHERKGTYLNASINPGPVGLFVGKDIDLRIFWGPWASAFAVEEAGKDAPRRSLQFFGKDGEAVHKIYAIEDTDLNAFHALVTKYTAPVQALGHEVVAFPPEPAEKPDTEVDSAGFQAEWVALKDTHDFYGMVRKYGLSRTQALRLAPAGNYAVPVTTEALRATVKGAAERNISIMVFIGNRGMIQIHSGEVSKVVDVPEWFNILDPDFNMHVREAAIVNSWVVRKPTVDGMVTALECYNAKGEMVVQLFGARKPGIPELESWRSLVAEVEKANQA